MVSSCSASSDISDRVRLIYFTTCSNIFYQECNHIGPVGNVHDYQSKYDMHVKCDINHHRQYCRATIFQLFYAYAYNLNVLWNDQFKLRVFHWPSLAIFNSLKKKKRPKVVVTLSRRSLWNKLLRSPISFSFLCCLTCLAHLSHEQY